jgi:hypothetical protein
MTEKLVKTGNDYILYSKDKTVLGITSGTMEGRMLSLKNCQVIENGYDLDEIRKLADEDFECELGDGPTTNESINSMIKKSNANGAEWGFKKALEILGGKKFSEEDVKFMFQLGFNLDNAISRNEYDAHIQSLQQTEWDVEICCYIGNGDKESDSFKDPLVTNTGIPKLDEDGCLILRRI